MSTPPDEQADRLFDAAREASDDDEALRLYRQYLALRPDHAAAHYNVGLIHKYRGDWQASLDANRRAVALDPEDEAANWNLAIAATALNDWPSAREVWHRLGYGIDLGDQPITADFGRALARLNPDGAPEVVWGRRVDPVRLRIENVPLPASGYRLGDVVLHDGAAAGQRESDGKTYSVFNAFGLHQPSVLSTFELEVDVSSADELERLRLAAEAVAIELEDWTAAVRYLCKACSEGLPHDHREGDTPPPAEWERRRRLGVALAEAGALEPVLQAWQGPGRQVLSLRLVLSPPVH